MFALLVLSVHHGYKEGISIGEVRAFHTNFIRREEDHPFFSIVSLEKCTDFIDRSTVIEVENIIVSDFSKTDESVFAEYDPSS